MPCSSDYVCRCKQETMLARTKIVAECLICSVEAVQCLKVPGVAEALHQSDLWMMFCQ